MATRACSVEGCTSRHSAKGYCARHYRRPPNKIACSVVGCDRPSRARTLCKMHYEQAVYAEQHPKQPAKFCDIAGCVRPYAAAPPRLRLVREGRYA
jgi:hypothetical protein